MTAANLPELPEGFYWKISHKPETTFPAVSVMKKRRFLPDQTIDWIWDYNSGYLTLAEKVEQLAGRLWVKIQKRTLFYNQREELEIFLDDKR